MRTMDEILGLFEQHGGSEYGGEAVTQLEHALQAAFLAEQSQAHSALIAAALLHDVGHLLHELPEDAPEAGIDDCHQTSAASFLAGLFPPAVTEPIRLHVEAKRYLCAVEPRYLEQLSVPSVTSLRLQGGPFGAAEVTRFRQSPFAEDALQLRRWDDAAKVPGLATPGLDHFRNYLNDARTEGQCLS